MRTTLFIGITVLAGAAGDISVTYAMKQIGEVQSFRPAVLFRFLGRAFRLVWMWIGIAFMALAFFSLLALLSWADASLVVPATALSYVAGAFGAKFLLHENVATVRWAGVLLVSMGVALLSIG